ncbi:hypothetical protein [Sandarakinorhabdus limnophila]|uniref:hypothetical protein n=1 Tax=Sandarakinorhabdus limnophila TaxID=210512 RepID=UPI0026F1DEB6|nr:hypothetical protein [Sandarakinorhabdus limnophila]
MASFLSNRNLAVANAALLAVVLVAVVRGASQFPALPLLVQIHLASMIIITGITVPMLLGPKGTARHRLLGRIWAGLMLGNALLTLCSMRVPGSWAACSWAIFRPSTPSACLLPFRCRRRC